MAESKFYFCEKCGKRLSDADLKSGAARDKQMRGKYCNDCAEGVMTVDYDAMSVEQAKALLGKTPQQATAKTPNDASVMKFYFCEHCGTRLTDKEITAGKGKDKKLRGVYCTKCSEGVLTMETMPVSEEEARRITGQKGRRRTSGQQQTGVEELRRRRKGSSRVRIPSAGSDASSTRRDRMPTASKGMPPIAWAGIGGAVLLLAVVGVMFAGGGKGDTARKSRSSKSKSSKKKSRVASSKNGTSTSHATASSTETASTTRSQPTPRANQAALLLRKAKGITETDMPSLLTRLQALEAIQNGHAGTPEAAEAMKMLAAMKFPNGENPEQLKNWPQGWALQGATTKTSTSNGDHVFFPMEVVPAAGETPVIALQRKLRVSGNVGTLTLAVQSTQGARGFLLAQVNGEPWLEVPLGGFGWQHHALDLKAQAGKEVDVALNLQYAGRSIPVLLGRPTFANTRGRTIRTVASKPLPPAEPNHPPIQNLTAWFRADKLKVKEGEQVIQWDDLSGQGNDLIQVNADQCPTLKANAINGWPAVRFDGNNDGLSCKLYLDVPHSYYVVLTGRTGDGFILGFPRTRGRLGVEGFERPAGMKFLVQNRNNEHSIRILASSIDDAKPHFLGAVLDGSNESFAARITIDGTQRFMQESVTPRRTTPGRKHFCVGSMPPETSGKYPLNGEVAEVLVYNVALSPRVQADVENYLKKKYFSGAKVDLAAYPVKTHTVAPRTTVARPATPMPVSSSEPSAHAEYVAFQRAFLTSLREGKRDEAEAALSKAEKNPKLKTLKVKVSRHRKATKWLAELDEAVQKGAAKLEQLEKFELKMKRGKPMTIGKKQEYQFVGFKKGGLDIGMKGMTMTVKLASLHPETLGKLREIGLGQDGAGWIRRSLSRLLAKSEKDADFSDIETLIKKARDLGAKAEEADYLSEMLKDEEGERQADLAFAKLQELFNTSQWLAYKEAYTKFRKDHGKSMIAAKGLPQLETKLARATKEAAEPFKTPLRGNVDFDWDAFAILAGSQETKPSQGRHNYELDRLQRLIWTQTSMRLDRAYAGPQRFHNNEDPANSHIRIAFKQPTPVSTILLKADKCRVSVLKSDVPYPGVLSNEAHWLPASPILKDDQTVWNLPPGTVTRAMRVSGPKDGTAQAGLHGAYLIPGLYTNIARRATAHASHSPEKAARLVNGLSDSIRVYSDGKGWDNGDQGAPQQVSRENPATVTLTWKEPVDIHGLFLSNPGFDKHILYAYSGPPVTDPSTIEAGKWNELGAHNSHWQFPRAFPLYWVTFKEPVRCTALRLKIVKSFYGPRMHPGPHLSGRDCGKKRVWLDEIIALTPVFGSAKK